MPQDESVSSCSADLIFTLNDQWKSQIFAHRALVLFRLIQRELNIDSNENIPLSVVISQGSTPAFIRDVWKTFSSGR